jgi:transketolase
MFAAQHRLENLIAIVDYNRIQALGNVKDIIELEPFAMKLQAFGWGVQEINGHDYQEIQDVLTHIPIEDGKPSWIIAHTTKGKGVSFLEDTVASHYFRVTDEHLKSGLKELEVVE